MRFKASLNLISDSASRLQKLAKNVLDGEATTAEKLAFRQSVSTHVAIQQSVAGMSAEAGRSLNAFRIPVQAGMQTGDKTAVFRSQLQETFERSGGDDTLYKLAEYIDRKKKNLLSLFLCTDNAVSSKRLWARYLWANENVGNIVAGDSNY